MYIGNVRTHAKDLKYQAKLSPIFLKSFIEGDELIPDFSVVFLKGGLCEMGDKQSRVLRPVLIVQRCVTGGMKYCTRKLLISRVFVFLSFFFSFSFFFRERN